MRATMLMEVRIFSAFFSGKKLYAKGHGIQQ